MPLTHALASDRGRQARLAAIATALLSALSVLALIMSVERVQPPARRAIPAVAATPPAPPPPILLRDLTPDQARVANMAAPFVAGPVAAAPPFTYRGSPADLAAAATCLAAAVLFEAGDDRPGEQAVAQVVLNRLRHPSFPKTVCGVVFQGAERATGCQFTFTCDGALARSQSPAAWARARDVAGAALAGFVYKPVGTATHYHTDWVVPYWRDSLAKIAQVHTQIFYGFPGRWGRPAALTGRPGAPERIDVRLLRFAPTPAFVPDLTDPEAPDPAAPRRSLTLPGVPPRALGRSVVRLANPEAAQYVLQLDPVAPTGWGVIGFTICAGHDDCLVLGWSSERETPRTLPVMPSAMRSLAFLYRKSSLTGGAQPLWDCARYRRPVRAQCLPGAR